MLFCVVLVKVDCRKRDSDSPHLNIWQMVVTQESYQKVCISATIKVLNFCCFKIIYLFFLNIILLFKLNRILFMAV